MTDILIISLVLVLVVLQGILFLRLRKQQDLVPELRQQLEEKHRAMLHDLHEGLTRLGDRLMASSADASERLRSVVSTELKQTRDAMQALELSQSQHLAQTRESVLEKLHQTLAEQGKAEQQRRHGR